MTGQKIQERNGPVHWGSREIAVGPITNHSNTKLFTAQEWHGPIHFGFSIERHQSP